LARFLAGAPLGVGARLGHLGKNRTETCSATWSYIIRTKVGQECRFLYSESEPFPISHSADLNEVCLKDVSPVCGLEVWCIEPDLNMGESLELRLHEPDFHLCSDDGKYQITARPVISSGKISLVVLEERMSEQTAKGQASLNLGKIELQLSDLLQLRKGMTIEFNRPAHFEAALEVMGRPIVHGRLSFEGDLIRFQVTSG
jgi:hypothetical protein